MFLIEQLFIGVKESMRNAFAGRGYSYQFLEVEG